MIKLYKNSKDFKWRNEFDFGVGIGPVITYPYPYSTFGYRGKSEPISGQLRYYPSKSRQIQVGTQGTGFLVMSIADFVRLS